MFSPQAYALCVTVRLTCYVSDTFPCCFLCRSCACVCVRAVPFWLLDVSVQREKASERQRGAGRVSGSGRGRGDDSCLLLDKCEASQWQTHTRTHTHTPARIHTQRLTRAKTCTNMFVLCVFVQKQSQLSTLRRHLSASSDFRLLLTAIFADL